MTRAAIFPTHHDNKGDTDMADLTDAQALKMYQFVRRLRDKLAIEINNGELRETGEFHAVCELLNDVGPAFRKPAGPPPGVAERRRTH
jgi:hypothetical protein